MSSLKYIADVNLMTVTLASAYTAADGHMHLTSGHGARLPASGDFWLRTTTGTYRCFKVTARSTDDLTVVPAQDGTSDGNLGSGAELKWILGATAFDQLKTDLIGPALVNPVYADFADVNSPAVTTTIRGITLSGAASSNVIGIWKDAPATPYTVIIAFNLICAMENYKEAGLLISDATKCIVVGCGYNAGQGVFITKWNTVNTWSASLLSVIPYNVSGTIWLKYYDNGTNRYYSISNNGIFYEQFYTEGRTTFLTATKLGVYTQSNHATRGIGATFIHWNIS